MKWFKDATRNNGRAMTESCYHFIRGVSKASNLRSIKPKPYDQLRHRWISKYYCVAVDSANSLTITLRPTKTMWSTSSNVSTCGRPKLIMIYANQIIHPKPSSGIIHITQHVAHKPGLHHTSFLASGHQPYMFTLHTRVSSECNNKHTRTVVLHRDGEDLQPMRLQWNRKTMLLRQLRNHDVELLELFDHPRVSRMASKKWVLRVLHQECPAHEDRDPDENHTPVAGVVRI